MLGKRNKMPTLLKFIVFEIVKLILSAQYAFRYITIVKSNFDLYLKEFVF